jgi:hypothetical protein
VCGTDLQWCGANCCAGACGGGSTLLQPAPAAVSFLVLPLPRSARQDGAHLGAGRCAGEQLRPAGLGVEELPARKQHAVLPLLDAKRAWEACGRRMTPLWSSGGSIRPRLGLMLQKT